MPTRVQFDRPNPGPYSQTAAPFHEWSREKDPFPLAEVIAAWGLRPLATDEDAIPIPKNAIVAETPQLGDEISEDDIPF